MSRRYYKQIDGKLVEVFPDNKPKNKGPYIGFNSWARQTKVEFNVSTMDESIKRMKEDK